MLSRKIELWTIDRMKGSVTCAYLGGSVICPKGVTEEGVPLMRLIFNEPLYDPKHIFVSRLGLPISLRVIS
jgi:hypothetical protein